MSEPEKIQMNIKQIKAFLLAGNATGTLINHNTGRIYTLRFHVLRHEDVDDQNPVWISVLAGPDKEKDYLFLGTIQPGRPNGWKLLLNSKSHWGWDDRTTAVVDWFLGYLDSERELPDGVEFKHAGKCGQCGRKLTTPKSLETGLGHRCAGES